MRDKLRTATRLDGERLDDLVAELKAKIADIAHYSKMRLLDRGRKGEAAAQECDDVARALRALIAAQERVDPAVRESVGIPPSALIHHLQVAKDMAAGYRKRVTKGPRIVRHYRDGLARAAHRIVLAHCFGIQSKRELRRAIAAVLEEAGYGCPNPKKDSARFDRMFQPLPPNTIDEDAREAAEKLEERLRNVPI